MASLTNIIAITQINPGINAKRNKFWYHKYGNKNNAKRAHTTDPVPSIALWIPYALPINSGAVVSAINASLGASLIHFPTLSMTLKTNTAGHVAANANSGFVIVEKLYPIRTNIFLFLNLSDKYHENTFNNAAVVSAAPSTIPITVAPAPKLVRNNGINGNTICELRSVSNDTNPKINTFLEIHLRKYLIFFIQSIWYKYYYLSCVVIFCTSCMKLASVIYVLHDVSYSTLAMFNFFSRVAASCVNFSTLILSPFC